MTKISIILVILFFSNISYAKECEYSGSVSLGFFNGVANTLDQAQKNLIWTKNIIQKQRADIKISGKLYYNETRYGGAEDIVEVFTQRLNESSPSLADRTELFFLVINGNDPTVNKLSNTSRLFTSAMDDFVVHYWRRGIATMSYGARTEQIYQEHRDQIDLVMKGKSKAFLVAHSQGNLFMNKLVSYATSKHKADKYKLGVIHVAPASTTVNGDWILADEDIIISTLRKTSVVPGVTDKIGPYAMRPPGLDGERDLMGHGYLSIYLAPGLSTHPHFLRSSDAIIKNFAGIDCDENVIKPIASTVEPSGFHTMCGDVCLQRNEDLMSGLPKEARARLFPYLVQFDRSCTAKAAGRWGGQRYFKGEWLKDKKVLQLQCESWFSEPLLSLDIPFAINKPPVAMPSKSQKQYRRKM